MTGAFFERSACDTGYIDWWWKSDIFKNWCRYRVGEHINYISQELSVPNYRQANKTSSTIKVKKTFQQERGYIVNLTACEAWADHSDLLMSWSLHIIRPVSHDKSKEITPLFVGGTWINNKKKWKFCTWMWNWRIHSINFSVADPGLRRLDPRQKLWKPDQVSSRKLKFCPSLQGFSLEMTQTQTLNSVSRF